MRKVNFIIAGAARCGTTAIHHYLDSHPEIFMSEKKETNFFLFHNMTHQELTSDQKLLRERSITTLGEYEKQFVRVKDEKILGEASPLYLASPLVANRIHKYNPDVKILVVLREPVDRAYSHFVKDNGNLDDLENKFIERISQEDPDSKALYSQGTHYIRLGFYARQLDEYLKVFPRGNLLILTYEEFKDNAQKFLSDVCQFLGVDPSFNFDSSYKLNASGKPKSVFLDQILTRSHRLKGILKRVLPARAKIKLIQIQNLLLGANLKSEGLSAQQRDQLFKKYFAKEIKGLRRREVVDLTRWEK